MTELEQAMSRIAAHERECAIRYENIEKRLEDGSKRFDKLESMIWAVYPFIVAVVGLAALL
jgi:TRAP-type uncharacterized transport system substrate-binding protein|tara:strand:+ start:4126 stop:4308 length:183 start_codon:yes stop_codon:yes gene_type:complete